MGFVYLHLNIYLGIGTFFDTLDLLLILRKAAALFNWRQNSAWSSSTRLPTQNQHFSFSE